MKLLLTPLLFLFALVSAPAWADAVQAKAAHVASGDEIALEGGQTLKLAGIHAPLAATKELANEAQAKLRALGEGQTLTLENASPDRYGRVAVDVFTSAGLELQIEMLRAGLAFVYDPVGDEPQLQAFLKAENEARAAMRGIWGDEIYADTPADKAYKKYGQFAFVTGKVLKTARVKNMVYLNFGPDWHTAFTVAIRGGDLRKFKKANVDPLEYEGKVLRVRGWVIRDYRPVIDATNPGQIEVLAAR